MTVRELYTHLSREIPSALSCEWDNDGLMCCPNENAPVRRVLVALDVTAAVAEKAISEGYDVILSHHPLIFRPLRALDPADPVAKKVIRLLCAGISVMSFHTRLDAVEGGVNDVLAEALGLRDVVPFGPEGEAIGRIGSLASPTSLSAFAALVKRATGATLVQAVDAGRQVSRVAVLGGSGSGDAEAARRAGADTYLSGELKHDVLTDAPEKGLNLVAAGHFHTEDPVCKRLCALVQEADPSIEVALTSSNTVTYC